ncbi:IS66 family transposase [Amphritea atlantica]|uniref:IS66 family transposase n=1 Tax=Amphritea atlantica TaxID=355243 RepID=A0ABY5GT14_9GAMM|nr:IS66 family transposase [Amphritea atlantica]UTW02817.1 IS66 family transposase [Amphritea atlantica]
MSAANKQLPNDPEALKRIIEQQANRIAALEESLRLQKLKKFGASSEKSPDQQEMFNEAELSMVVEEYLTESEAEQAQTELKTPKAKPGRKPLPAGLPRVRIEHDLSELEKQCPCGHERTEIGETTSEQLDIIPAQIRVLVNVRKKYACPTCEDGVQTALLPPQPIPKSNASPGLLAHIVTAKYQDALPLYRQEAILNRSGIEIPRNTLASWMIKAGELTQPLLNLLEDSMLAYPVLHCDETSVQVLKEPDKDAASKSYMWVRVGGPPTQPVRLFHYADSRRGEVASQLLAGYEGYLQTDDYAGYNAVGANGVITQLGCWAHARRKFIEAQKATAGKNKKAGKADMAVSLIGKLYAIEKKIKAESTEVRYQVRQQEAVPQLQKIRTWLDNTLHSTLPKGLLGKALSYLDKNWDKLTVYTEDGRLAIDNNPAENAIRPFVVGRKNWLFSATVPGAKSSANLYSLIETAKANQLEPYQYLRYIFEQLPKAKRIDQIEVLLPWNVTLQDAVN